jgi:hypothetical protein
VPYVVYADDTIELRTGADVTIAGWASRPVGGHSCIEERGRLRFG